MSHAEALRCELSSANITGSCADSSSRQNDACGAHPLLRLTKGDANVADPFK